jgi:hypothetical protein
MADETKTQEPVQPVDAEPKWDEATWDDLTEAWAD